MGARRDDGKPTQNPPPERGDSARAGPQSAVGPFLGERVHLPPTPLPVKLCTEYPIEVSSWFVESWNGV